MKKRRQERLDRENVPRAANSCALTRLDWFFCLVLESHGLARSRSSCTDLSTPPPRFDAASSSEPSNTKIKHFQTLSAMHLHERERERRGSSGISTEGRKRPPPSTFLLLSLSLNLNLVSTFLSFSQQSSSPSGRLATTLIRSATCSTPAQPSRDAT